MSKTLVIVESPAKAKTISRFLGKDYDVQASFGHVRDLPQGTADIPAELKKKKWARLGVDVEGDFTPIYVVPADKKKYVAALRSAAKGVESVLLATDEDREGESISWHVLQILKLPKSVKVQRIVFHEITPEAIAEALASPRDIDESLVRAQEARRILDRLYGYTLSPLLWRKIAPKLSAGRVQSVATRLVVLRERERRLFVIAEYSGVEATLEANGEKFDARLRSVDDARLAEGEHFGSDGKLTSGTIRWLKSKDAESIQAALEGSSPWTVTELDAKPGRENPPVPFMTSTLQQEANRKLGYTARRTMQIAQQLYEGIDLGGGERVGLITYMRTDSLTLADRAIRQAREVIADLYGAEYVPAKPKRYKSKSKNAQEAHEAIRPSDLARRPQDVKSSLSAEQFKLYDLIWKRTIACQMKPAEVERTRVSITVSNEGSRFVFAASGKSITFPGFLKAYVEGADDPDADLANKERTLPNLNKGQELTAAEVRATEHATRPPARFTEASLVKELESEGVGRPSTYASILGTIEDRGYIFKKGRELVPTFTAFAVTDLLENNFPELVDTTFTAQLEEQLDEIANGDLDHVGYLREFYTGTEEHPGIEPQVTHLSKDIPFPAIPVGDDIIVRIGRNGPFLQRGEGGPGNTASVPGDLPPAELTLEIALELLAQKKAGGQALGEDPATGQCVLHKTGRFGDYLEVEQTKAEKESGDKPRRITIPKELKPAEIGDEELAILLSYPREIGKHPESGDMISVALGKFGPYLICGDKKANVGDWREGASVTVDEAVEFLVNAKKARSGPEIIKDFGELEGLEGPVQLLSGRYGPYVKNGKVNATLPKGLAPEDVTPEKAVELVKKKAAKGPTKRRRFTKKK